MVAKVLSTGFTLGAGDLPPRGTPRATVVGTGTLPVSVGLVTGVAAPPSPHNTFVPTTYHHSSHGGHLAGVGPTKKSHELGGTKTAIKILSTSGPTTAGLTMVLNAKPKMTSIAVVKGVKEVVLT